MKVLDLFSGIGGFSLGLERAGMQTVAFCEYDKHAQKVLKKHWPNVPIYPDVKELTYEQLAADGIAGIDVITGGYPCQPFSTAGKRAGAQDDRHLWPEMLRIIKAVWPRWVIAENVAGHISMGLDQVLSDLEAEEYTVWTFVIPACAVDAPHRRDRVWIVADAGCRRRSEQGKREIQQQGRTETIGASDFVPDSNSFGCNERRERFSETWSNGLVGNSRWAPEPGICRVVDGVPNRVERLKRLGNAVVPHIPEIIGMAIMQLERANTHV